MWSWLAGRLFGLVRLHCVTSFHRHRASNCDSCPRRCYPVTHLGHAGPGSTINFAYNITRERASERETLRRPCATNGVQSRSFVCVRARSRSSIINNLSSTAGRPGSWCTSGGGVFAGASEQCVCNTHPPQPPLLVAKRHPRCVRLATRHHTT